MIQDIAPHQYHTEYSPVPVQDDSVILAYRGRTVLVRLEGEDKSFSYPTYADLADVPAERFRWLFREDDINYFLALEDIPEGKGFAYISINFMRAPGPAFRPLRRGRSVSAQLVQQSSLLRPVRPSDGSQRC